jgi:phosphatidylglycerol:prolipoprotein diacylglycerol transferase
MIGPARPGPPRKREGFSLHPILFDLGPFSLHSYGLAMALAFGLGIWIAIKRSPARHFAPTFALDLSVQILIWSLAGARAMYVVTHWDEFKGHLWDIISPVQANGQIGIAGLVLLGGVAAGFAVTYFYARKRGHAFFAVTDLFMPSLALGVAIGRLGCFFNGCCFGLPAHVPWCVHFPPESLAGYVYPHACIHPTQIYEALVMLLTFGALLWFDRTPRPTGQPTGIFLLIYGLWRFYNESLRWYEADMIVLDTGGFRLTVSQVISGLMVAAGLYLLLTRRTVKR